MKTVSEKNIDGKVLQLVLGDITERDTDAIVNAANKNLQHGGGVAGAIVRKGGAIIQEESNRIGFVPTGNAVMTSAGSLKAKFVIHAVGPHMGEGDEEMKLTRAVQQTLLLASERGLKSISMPAISSGIFGFPKERCAKILVSESNAFLKKHPESSLGLIEFCIFDDETLGFFQQEFAKL
ncbi:MAG TPA: macro domain-containing protein [Dissulfurispiraceae bacterium]|nr:macro domain-containing protein [Dissulfurispiraceae bacterium]